MGVKRLISKGERFGYLRVIKELEPKAPDASGKRRRMFLFKCDCGNKTIVSLSGVVTGNTSSCGCYATKRRKEAQTTHGLSNLLDKKLYQVWLDMHSRCYNKKNAAYRYYGEEGISISTVWHRKNPKGLQNFIKWAYKSGYKHGLQLDREDNDKNYSPNNCRWVTAKVNQRNKRDTIMIVHPVTEKEISLADYYDEVKPRKSYSTIYRRYRLSGNLADCFL